MDPKGFCAAVAAIAFVACGPLDSSSTRAMCPMLCTQAVPVTLEPPFTEAGDYLLVIEAERFTAECSISIPLQASTSECVTTAGENGDQEYKLELGSDPRWGGLALVEVPTKPASIRVSLEDMGGVVLDETVRPTYVGEDSSVNCSCRYGTATIATR